MGREEFEVLKSGILKRKTKRCIGLFIDGIGLDRATRRLNKKIDLARLVSGLCSGLEPEIARYYTLVPHEDDARQFAFLDAVERAGLEVVVKRLPPKEVKRQVSMDVHMATDIVSFGCGISGALSQLSPSQLNKKDFDNKDSNAKDSSGKDPLATNGSEQLADSKSPNLKIPNLITQDQNIKRIATVVCPNRELSYAIHVANLVGVETSLVDFGLYGSSDGWKGVDRWVDLSTSETIWRRD